MRIVCIMYYNCNYNYCNNNNIVTTIVTTIIIVLQYLYITILHNIIYHNINNCSYNYSYNCVTINYNCMFNVLHYNTCKDTCKIPF